jgi:hypothetical protein
MPCCLHLHPEDEGSKGPPNFWCPTATHYAT